MHSFVRQKVKDVPHSAKQMLLFHLLFFFHDKNIIFLACLKCFMREVSFSMDCCSLKEKGKKPGQSSRRQIISDLLM